MLTERDLAELSKMHANLWPQAKQRPDSNDDIAWVWRKVCGDNSLEACRAAFRRHAASSKFPARPGDIAALLPAPPVKRLPTTTEAERAAYIAQAQAAVAQLVNISTDHLLLAWEIVKRILSRGDHETYQIERVDPRRYETMHPDLQLKLHFEAANIGLAPPKMLWVLAGNVPGLREKIIARAAALPESLDFRPVLAAISTSQPPA